MKKRMMTWLMAFVLLFCILTNGFVYAENTAQQGISTVTTQPYNVMILIDKSGSMNATDGGRISLSAACQFVDELCENYGTQAAKTTVGVMAFSQTTELLTDPVKLDTETNTSLVKAGINSIVYNESGTGGTDLGTAVNDAAIVLQRLSKENDKNMIVLFTDGYSERVLNEQAYQDNLQNAFQISAQMGMEVYIVGLNYQNKMTEDGKHEIWNIADTTQTNDGVMSADANDFYATHEKVNYLITDNMNDVREFYGQIHASMSGSEIEYIDTNQFTITTSGVIEADITVYSQGEIFGVTITAPDGTQMQENGTTYIVKGDSYYKVIKIANPQIGVWTIDVSSADDEHKTYLVRIYGVEIAVSALCGAKTEFPDCTIEADNVGRVTVTPLYKSELYQDESFAASLTKSEFIASSGEWQETYPLQYNEETGQLVGYFPVNNGDYHIQADIATTTMSRLAECDLNVNLEVPTQSSELNIGTIAAKLGETVEVDLSKLSGGVELTVNSCWTGTQDQGNAQLAGISNNGSTLRLSALQEGTDTFGADASDAAGNQYHFSGSIQIEKEIQLFNEDVGTITLELKKEAGLNVEELLKKEGLIIQKSQLDSGGENPIAELTLNAEKGEISITALKTGTDSFHIFAIDAEENQYIITGIIIVNKPFPILKVIIGVVAVVVILVGIGIALKIKGPGSVPGNFTVEIVDEDPEGKDGSFSFSLSAYPNKSSFSLWKLLETDVQQTKSTGEELTEAEKAREELCAKVRSRKSEIQKVKIVLHQTTAKDEEGKEIIKGTYELLEKGRRIDLIIPKCCYECSEVFKINVQFEAEE